MLPALTPDFPAERHPAIVYLASLSSTSRITVRYSLNIVAEMLGYTSYRDTPWHLLRYSHMQALRSTIAERYAPTTARKMISFVCNVLKTAKRLELMSVEDYSKAVDISPVRGEMPPAGRSISDEEIARLLRACAADQTLAGARDGALIALLATTGIRRSEAVGIAMEHYDKQGGVITLVKTKGNRSRTVPVVSNAKRFMDDWIAMRGNQPGRVFLALTPNGAPTHRGIGQSTVQDILERRRVQAGVDPFTSHDFRRTVVGNLLQKGVDVGTTQKLTGHKKVDTLLRYDRRPAELVKSAVELYNDVPYFERSPLGTPDLEM